MDFWNHYFTHSPFYIFYNLKMLFYLLMIYVNNCSMYFQKQSYMLLGTLSLKTYNTFQHKNASISL